jgi:hypothetical protein
MQMTEPVSYPEFADLLTRSIPNPATMQFTEKELDMYIDLRSYIFFSFLSSFFFLSF